MKTTTKIPHNTAAMLHNMQDVLADRIRDWLAEDETALMEMTGTMRQLDEEIAEKMAAAAMAEYTRSVEIYAYGYKRNTP